MIWWHDFSCFVFTEGLIKYIFNFSQPQRYICKLAKKLYFQPTFRFTESNIWSLVLMNVVLF